MSQRKAIFLVNTNNKQLFILLELSNMPLEDIQIGVCTIQSFVFLLNIFNYLLCIVKRYWLTSYEFLVRITILFEWF